METSGDFAFKLHTRFFCIQAELVHATIRLVQVICRLQRNAFMIYLTTLGALRSAFIYPCSYNDDATNT